MHKKNMSENMQTKRPKRHLQGPKELGTLTLIPADAPSVSKKPQEMQITGLWIMRQILGKIIYTNQDLITTTKLFSTTESRMISEERIGEWKTNKGCHHPMI